MKVLHFLDTLGRGGAEMQALDVCRNAARYGFEMTLVCAGGGALEDEFRATGVDFIKLRRRLPVDPSLTSQLRKIIKEREIEIVHGYQAVDGLHLYFAARRLGIVKKVLSFQGFLQDSKNRLASKYLIPRMDANIVVSRGLQKWLRETSGLDTSKNFTVIYNGADPERVKPTGKSLKAELGLADDSPLIGMIGSFYRDPRKDQLTLCKALPEVFAQIENAHCIFAGRVEPGAEEKYGQCVSFCRENGIADRAHFLGMRSDVPDILAALDLFVFSSLHEGLPVAVSEAMLAGVPIIVSDIEPLLEATANGRFAEVFPVKDVEVLTEKILLFMKDKGLRDDLADRALKHAEENFSIDAHMRELKKMYQRLMTPSEPAP
jgi:glycosyltransferase involved in cell wall biosynthesis